jgi:hypothetical protein
LPLLPHLKDLPSLPNKENKAISFWKKFSETNINTLDNIMENIYYPDFMFIYLFFYILKLIFKYRKYIFNIENIKNIFKIENIRNIFNTKTNINLINIKNMKYILPLIFIFFKLFKYLYLIDTALISNFNTYLNINNIITDNCSSSSSSSIKNPIIDMTIEEYKIWISKFNSSILNMNIEEYEKWLTGVLLIDKPLPGLPRCEELLTNRKFESEYNKQINTELPSIPEDLIIIESLILPMVFMPSLKNY